MNGWHSRRKRCKAIKLFYNANPSSPPMQPRAPRLYSKWLTGAPTSCSGRRRLKRGRLTLSQAHKKSDVKMANSLSNRSLGSLDADASSIAAPSAQQVWTDSFNHDLRAHLALCQEVMTLVTRENQALSSPDSYS